MSENADIEVPMSRPRSDSSEMTEVRQDTPRCIVDILDAVSRAKGKNRGWLVNQILARWARERVHEWTLIHRITGGNPTAPDDDGALSE